MKRREMLLFATLLSLSVSAREFELNEKGYFQNQGVSVMVFDDVYPEGHQSGVCLIMNGNRIATNGDLRLEQTPGQWQPLPKQRRRQVSGNRITTYLSYPDSSKHETGFNPIIYPNLQLSYNVVVEPDGDDIIVTVNLDQPVPKEFLGKVGFNFELFPGSLFGKPWLMDNQSGIYPQQPNSPLLTMGSNMEHRGDFHQSNRSRVDLDHLLGDRNIYNPIVADDIIAYPYAEGRVFTSRPDDHLNRVTIETLTSTPLKLYDGRMNHNNGWFVLRSDIPEGATTAAVKWRISPTITDEWIYTPVVQTSQVGYLPAQPKVAIVELDSRDTPLESATLVKMTAKGDSIVRSIAPQQWGSFLRYNYLKIDFTDVTDNGMYQVIYGDSRSPIFGISETIYSRGVWQPVLEYFLPVQMCHMRVNEKYRVWHDACHMDDATMAPAHNHIDGYDQKPGLSKYSAGDQVPGVNIGGWHDAGDFDLRIESQSGECYILSLAYEAFKPDIDVTSINQATRVCEIHQPDGKNDLLQQVEHGALSIVNGYLSLGRLYRGIICRDLRQYVLLGDAASMTDGDIGNSDDRWIFTENNPGREISTATNLAATARVLRGFNDTLSVHCLTIAETIYEAVGSRVDKTHAAAELYLTTGDEKYMNYLLDNQESITKRISSVAWYLARVDQKFAQMKRNNRAKQWSKEFRKALPTINESLAKQVAQTPYGVPYSPAVWGEGWDIQSFGFRHYFLASAYPEIFSAEPVASALNFVLGAHPGTNQASYASGVGATSATVGYGLNRADWSYIPGGVISGTGLIRPDFPELLTFPFLWQQTEYVLGGGSSHYMFIVLAANQLYGAK